MKTSRCPLFIATIILTGCTTEPDPTSPPKKHGLLRSKEPLGNTTKLPHNSPPHQVDLFAISINNPVILIKEPTPSSTTDTEFRKTLSSLIAEARQVDSTPDYNGKIARLEALIRKVESEKLAAASVDTQERAALLTLKRELDEAYKRADLWSKLVNAHAETNQNQTSAIDCAAAAEAERIAADAIIKESIFSAPDKMKAEEAARKARLRFALAKADLAQAAIQRARKQADSPSDAIQATKYSVELFDGLLSDESKFDFRLRTLFGRRKAEVQAEFDKLTALNKHLTAQAIEEIKQEREKFILSKALADIQSANETYKHEVAIRFAYYYPKDLASRNRLMSAVRLCDRILETKNSIPDDLRTQASYRKTQCRDLAGRWHTSSAEADKAIEIYKQTGPLPGYDVMSDYPPDNTIERVNQKWKSANL